MKFISWNVNGLRAVVQKNFLEVFEALDADFFCLQETKMQAGQLELELPGYFQYYNYAVRKGYSGTAIFTKHQALAVNYGIGEEIHDQEGRVITLEYANFFLVTCYTPNSQGELKRLPYRMDWEEAFKNYLNALQQTKPVVLCGDLNVAHENIDLKNWKTNQHNAGFTIEEREKFSQLLETGFIDTFRYFNPTLEGAYSWWSYRFNARKNNAGWRIDYFLTSETLKNNLVSANILQQITGSDHCPVELDLNFTAEDLG
ncbi:exodeoxyribonuclease III [Enterococcus timonensis]|uniref:exodeoxyribonuclease III n=1 Tax=Enterococcus timonensis TaxID=1852364 RepID=UPI0008DAB767|nr:exodeoxyribonuclease III [Enterococcus timonensis]